MGPTLHLRTTAFALIASCAMAVSLPLMSTLGQGATFFIVHNAGAQQIILFTLLIYLAPPMLLLALPLVIDRFSRRAARGMASAMIGLWAVSIAGDVPNIATASIALSVTATAMWAYLCLPNFRELLCIAGYLSPLLLVNFLGFTPTSKLLLPTSGPESALAKVITPRWYC